MKIPKKNRRRVFRLRLPNDGLLKADIAGRSYELIEVSEYGIVVTSNSIAGVSGRFSGVIKWSDGAISDFKGELGRLSIHGRVIWKVAGITMSHVVMEQRRLLAKFALPLDIKKSA